MFLALLSILEQDFQQCWIAAIHWLSSLIIDPCWQDGVLLVEGVLPGAVQMGYQDKHLL
jgi:hypothetical protein